MPFFSVFSFQGPFHTVIIFPAFKHSRFLSADFTTLNASPSVCVPCTSNPFFTFIGFPRQYNIHQTRSVIPSYRHSVIPPKDNLCPPRRVLISFSVLLSEKHGRTYRRQCSIEYQPRLALRFIKLRLCTTKPRSQSRLFSCASFQSESVYRSPVWIVGYSVLVR